MLSQKTKYGLKALTFLARTEADVLQSASCIASHENIPSKYLESILNELKRNGLVHSKKGKNGGYALARPASEIKMSTVHRMLEGPIAMLPCVSLNYYQKCSDCPDEHTCSVNRLMLQVRDSTLAILEHQTLADISAQ